MSTWERIRFCGPDSIVDPPAGLQMNGVLEYAPLVAEARRPQPGLAERSIASMGRMSRDGKRKSKGFCWSHPWCREAAASLLARQPDKVVSAWPGETDTALMCIPNDWGAFISCPPCAVAVKRFQGGNAPRVVHAADESSDGLKGWPMLPGVALAWYEWIANRLPNKVIAGGLYAQAAYPEPLTSIPSRLTRTKFRPCVALNLTSTPHARYEATQLARWAEWLVPRFDVIAYTVIRRGNEDGQEAFILLCKALGYSGVIVERTTE